MKKQTENIRIISASVPVLFFRNIETGNIIADCPVLRITSCGKTITQAKKNFHEAFCLWYETIIEMGTIKQALIELGWKIYKQSIQLPKQANFSHRNIPVELLSTINQNFNISSAYLQ
jgi:hypothetical protein